VHLRDAWHDSTFINIIDAPSDYYTDENFCEKYPDESVCNPVTLPMLLTVPTFSSYTSSESILGLGDMVLPGK
jgi:hypothetical protein